MRCNCDPRRFLVTLLNVSSRTGFIALMLFDAAVGCIKGTKSVMHNGERIQWVTWPSNSLRLPSNMSATWDASYQPPLWGDASAACTFDTTVDQVADYRWIIHPHRLTWISSEPVWVHWGHFLGSRYVPLFIFLTSVYDVSWCWCWWRQVDPLAPRQRFVAATDLT